MGTSTEGPGVEGGGKDGASDGEVGGGGGGDPESGGVPPSFGGSGGASEGFERRRTTKSRKNSPTFNAINAREMTSMIPRSSGRPHNPPEGGGGVVPEDEEEVVLRILRVEFAVRFTPLRLARTVRVKLPAVDPAVNCTKGPVVVFKLPRDPVVDQA